VGHAEWLAQTSRRPDIEAALSQFLMARRAPSPSPSRTGKCPPATLANVPEPMDCNAAEGLSHEGTEEIASSCAQMHEIDLCDEQRQDPLARPYDPWGGDLVHGVSMPCLPAVAAPPAMWPQVWVAWPFYPSFQQPLPASRMRAWRRRFFYPSGDESADENGGDGHRERG
jgi:hypothetical protein